MPATPLVQDVVLANLQRRSLSDIHPQASKPISVLGVLGRQSASAASRERRNSLGRETRNSLTRRSVPAVLPTKSSWVKVRYTFNLGRREVGMTKERNQGEFVVSRCTI